MSEALTQILEKLDGDPDSAEKILPLVYAELRSIAAVHLRRERPGHTLVTTDLVHEAYLRMFERGDPRWNDRRHFFAAAAQAMRRILVDHARRRSAKKRVDPDEGIAVMDRSELSLTLSYEELLDLDRALTSLEDLDQRQSEIVHFRVFAGLSGSETAELMQISERTVAREWWSAKLWLREQMGEQ